MRSRGLLVSAMLLAGCADVLGADFASPHGPLGHGGAGGGAATITYPDIGAFCTGLGLAECSDTLVSVCDVPNKTTCQGAVDQQCVAGTSDITFGRNTATYQPAKGDACVNAAKAAYTDAVVTATEYASIRSACDLAFSNLRDVGFECNADADCDITQGLVCTVVGGTNKCEKPGTVTKGGDCTNAACMPPLVCGPSNFCVAGRDEGSPCTNPTDPCSPGLLCESGSCVIKHADGADCASSSECASAFCARVPDVTSMPPNPNRRECLTKLIYGTGAPLCDNFK